jgi:MFS family permease
MTTITVTAPAAARPQLFTSAVVRLFAAEFAAMSGFYLLLPVVAMYSTARGFGSAGAGLTTGVLMFSSVAAELATPRLAARLGYRRLLVAGLVLLGAPALVLPAISGLPGLLAVSMLRGIGFATVVVAIGAMTAAVISAQRRGEGLGVLGVVATVPAVLMLPLGVWMVSEYGFGPVFGVGAAVVLVAIAFVAPLPASTAGDHAAALWPTVRRPGVRRPTLVFAATAVAGGVVVAFVPAAVSSSVAVAGLFVQAATATVTRWLAGRHSDRHGAAGLLVPAVVASALGLAAVVLVDRPVAVIAGLAVFGAGFGAAQSASLNAMLQRVSRPEYGAVSAAWNGAYDLGWGAGAAGIGMVVTAFGYPVAFAVTAVIVLAVLPLARLRNC